MWKKYSPPEMLVIDRLVIPPGMDMDNLILQVDMNSEEYLITLQGLRQSPMNYLIETTFTVKKNGEKSYYSGNSDLRKKDQGFTQITTPHEAKNFKVTNVDDFLKIFGGE